MAQNCHIEGYNFGSVSSDYFVVAYDKSAERVHAAILLMGIPADRDHPFWFIVTADSGLS
jgi:hypothetical protein